MPRPQRHDIYRNLNKRKGNPSLYVWSLRLTGGRVQGHSETALLLDPEFKCAESTRQGIVRKGQRAICAFIRGELVPHSIDSTFSAPRGERVRISYNPFTCPTFYRCDTKAPVTAADAVVFTSTGCFAINPR